VKNKKFLNPDHHAQRRSPYWMLRDVPWPLPIGERNKPPSTACGRGLGVRG